MASNSVTATVGENEKNEFQKFDAVELTLLLKHIGFRLESIDFDKTVKNGEGIHIYMACRQTGLVSKMSYGLGVCTCPPEKTSNNNAFWEIQGTDPNTGNANETSSNLLPVLGIGYTTALKAGFKLLHSILLAAYTENDINGNAAVTIATTKEITEALIGLKDKFAHSNVNHEDRSPFMDQQIPSDHCGTPLSSINITPTAENQFVDPSVGIPKIILSSNCEYSTPTGKFPSEDTGETFTSPNSDIFTASPNNSNFLLNDQQPKKNSNILKHVKDAHEKISYALHLLENDTNKDSISCSTPALPKKLERSSTKLVVRNTITSSRRHSLSAIPLDSTKIIAPRKSLSNVPAIIKTEPKIKKPSLTPKNGKILKIKPPISTIPARLNRVSTMTSPSTIANNPATTPRSFAISKLSAVKYRSSSQSTTAIPNNGSGMKPPLPLSRISSRSLPKLPQK